MKLFIVFLISTIYANAAQWATVIREKAIVYSDQQMTSEIGYVKRGKKVRVGEVARNRGTLLPIIVNKRIAYIRIEDIKTATDEKLVVSAVARKRKLEDKSKKQQRIGLSYTRFFSNIQSIENSETSESYSFNGGALKGYSKNNQSRFTYAAEIGYMSGTDEDEVNEFELYYFNFDIMFRLIDFDNLQFSLFTGLSLIPVSQYSYNDLFKANSSGIGGYGGAELFMGLNNSIGLHARAQYSYINLEGYDIPKNDEVGVDARYEPNLSGISFVGALTYEF